MGLPEIVQAAIDEHGYLKSATEWEPYQVDLSDKFTALMPSMAELLASMSAYSALFPALGSFSDPDSYIPERRSIMLFWETSDRVDWCGLIPASTMPHIAASEALAIFTRDVGVISSLPPDFYSFGGGLPVCPIDWEEYFETLGEEAEDVEEDPPEARAGYTPFPLAESLFVASYSGSNLAVEHDGLIRTVSIADEGLIFGDIGAENHQVGGSNTIYGSNEIATFQQLAERVAAIALGRFITPAQKQSFHTDKDIELGNLYIADHVEEVWFGRCKVSGVVTGNVGNPKVLTRLDLRDSSFLSDSPFEGLSLPALKQLWLRGMKAKRAFPLSACPGLECLWLTSSTAADQFCGVVLSALRELQIDKPTGNSVFPLTASPELKELHLTNGELSDEWVDEIVSLGSLSRLHLTDSPISRGQFERLSECRALEWLDLCGTGVGDEGATVLSELDRLEILWIGRTAITEAAFHHLEALPLQHLSCGPFGRAGMRSIQKMRSLESLSVNGPVKDRWRRKLEASGIRVWESESDE